MVAREENSPLVSVIMPAFNEEKRIGQMLESLVCQSYKKIEIIVIDDGSTDGTYEVCKKYKAKDCRIRVFRQRNKGCDCARNLALRHIKGKYILFADGDDYYEKNAIQILVEKMERNNLDVINYNARCFYDGANESGTRIKKNRYIKKNNYNKNYYNGLEYFKLLRSKKDFSSVIWSFIVKSELVKRHKLRFINIPKCRHGDVLFSFEFLYYADRVGFTKEILYNRRVREGSISTSKKGVKDLFSYYYIVKKLRHEYDRGDDSIIKFIDDIEKMNKQIYKSLPDDNNFEIGFWSFDRGFAKYLKILRSSVG